jgi:hypothetical protein
MALGEPSATGVRIRTEAREKVGSDDSLAAYEAGRALRSEESLDPSRCCGNKADVAYIAKTQITLCVASSNMTVQLYAEMGFSTSLSCSLE